MAVRVADLVALAADGLRKRSLVEMQNWASRVSLSLAHSALLFMDGRSREGVKFIGGNDRRFESDKHSNAVITPPGISPDFHVDFLDFEWERRIVKKYDRMGADHSMANSIRKNKRILLVEDQEDAWEIVELALTECKLTFARTFDQGLRLARQGYFDLYILDNWLPDGSGIGLCFAIRQFDPHTPIVFYSAAAYERDIQEALRSGAQGYLVKPVKFDDLEGMVAKLTSPISTNDSEAWRAEIAAVREELAIRYNEQAQRMKGARDRHLRAEEKLMRLKAEKAFLDAGGTRGDFARRWPSVFTEEVRSQRKSDAASGH